jgi:hypothetical protein
MTSDHGNGSRISIGKIDLPNFEVSWAGGNPWAPGYCFGSDDGRIQFTGLDTPEGAGPYAVAPSEDAINGIAFAGSLMAASTRSDVVFLNVPFIGKGNVERAVFYGGAHGVVGTQCGSIVAPMGNRGILLMGPKQDSAQRVKVLKPADEALNIYKVVSLASSNREEILACAARRSGFAAMPITGAGLQGFGKRLRPAGMDFVDVAALGVDGFPFAAAALGLDCSIHFVRDLLSDRTTKTLRFNAIGERAYRILCAEGHVFLLTDRRLYAFIDLAARFLEDKAIDGSTLVHCMDLEAVDVSMAFDRSLLVVMPESVYRIRIDSLVTGSSRQCPMELGDELWESFDESPWEQPKELELATVT